MCSIQMYFVTAVYIRTQMIGNVFDVSYKTNIAKLSLTGRVTEREARVFITSNVFTENNRFYI